jgi:hypothetical protein
MLPFSARIVRIVLRSQADVVAAEPGVASVWLSPCSVDGELGIRRSHTRGMAGVNADE